MGLNELIFLCVAFLLGGGMVLAGVIAGGLFVFRTKHAAWGTEMFPSGVIPKFRKEERLPETYMQEDDEYAYVSDLEPEKRADVLRAMREQQLGDLPLSAHMAGSHDAKAALREAQGRA